MNKGDEDKQIKENEKRQGRGMIMRGIGGSRGGSRGGIKRKE